MHYGIKYYLLCKLAKVKIFITILLRKMKISQKKFIKQH